MDVDQDSLQRKSFRALTTLGTFSRQEDLFGVQGQGKLQVSNGGDSELFLWKPFSMVHTYSTTAGRFSSGIFMDVCPWGSGVNFSSEILSDSNPVQNSE